MVSRYIYMTLYKVNTSW